MEVNTTWNVLTGLALLAPLLSFLLCLLISDRYSWLATMIATFFLLVSAVLSVWIFFAVPAGQEYIIQLEWFQVNGYVFSANLELNRFSILMLPLVNGISFLVHLYSIGYMAGDNGIRRYFAMLGFFTFSMTGIILSDNLIPIFAFWELVGFSSYMLIGHWLQKPEAAKAAKKAFIFNRIGDAGFLIGLMIIWTNTQTFNLSDLLPLAGIESWQTAASLFIFCGVIGKSAQFPLFTWLPDAMEGPTPVSALIHAATMVAAGVFLLVRVFPLFTPTSLEIVTVIGTLTALLAAITALNQFDIKKILAYSTISQLGLMVAAVGVGSENAAMLHLFSHGFFKAGIFLAAGSVIHALHHSQQQSHNNFDVQDIRYLGGLRKKLPFTCIVFVITGASLAGVPFFSGFLSKDSILTSAWLWGGSAFSWKWIIIISLFVVSFITVLYTFRMIWYIFFSKENNSSISESPMIMRIPMGITALASFWLIVSWSPFSVYGWFVHLIGNLQHSNLVTILATGTVAVAFVTAWFIYASKPTSIKSNSFIKNGFGLDLVYEKVIGGTVTRLATVSEVFDRKWIDGFLHFTAYATVSISHVVAWFDFNIVDGVVNVIAWLSKQIGSVTRSFQGGKIQFYIFWALTGLIIFLFFMLI